MSVARKKARIYKRKLYCICTTLECSAVIVRLLKTVQIVLPNHRQLQIILQYRNFYKSRHQDTFQGRPEGV